MSSSVSILLKNQDLERRLDEVERMARSSTMSFPYVAIPELRSVEFERRLEEMERRAGATATAFPCVAIPDLKSLELERRLEEMERRARATATTFPCVALPDLKSLELERRLEEIERRAGARATTFPSVCIPDLRSLELERRLEEMERRAASTATTISCVKGLELERRIEEMERKAGALATTLPCVSIPDLKSLELERRLEEMERKICFRGTTLPYISMQLKNYEVERSLEEMAQLKAALQKHEQRLAEIDWKGIARGASSAPPEVLLKIQLEGREIEQRIAELEKGTSSVVRNSACEEIWRQRKEELDRKCSEFRWKFAGSLEAERLEKLAKESQELDLAFLVDATSSMRNVFESIKKHAEEISVAIRKEWPQLKLRLAFAPYRDYGDKVQDDEETIVFTDDHHAFVEDLKEIRAEGASSEPRDTAEDVFSGLQRVAAKRLDWKSRTRVLVHIADAPCHGQEFHNFSEVDRPGSDYLWDRPDKSSVTLRDKRVVPLGKTGAGLDLRKLLKTLREDRQIIRYLFCHLDKFKTEKMLRVFKNCCGDKNWIQEEDLPDGDLSKLLDVVVKVCAISISLSMQGGESSFVGSNSDSWEAIPCKPATQLQYKLPDSLDELFKVVATNGKLERIECPDLLVQIRRNFSPVESRIWPYHAVLYKPGSARREMLVKPEFKAPDIWPDETYDYTTYANEAYFDQLELHSVVVKLAEEFNKVLKSNANTVQFIPMCTLKVGPKFYTMEQSVLPTRTKYPGAILDLKIPEEARYTGSILISKEDEKAYAHMLQAFSHWTYHCSKGLLVIDGFELAYFKDKSPELWLCDPALHCTDPLRYQTTGRNWGVAGMKHFLETHQCNGICESLHLPSAKVAARYL